MTPNTTTEPMRARIPAAAATARPRVTSPSRASNASANTGMPSFTKAFHTPVTMADRVMATNRNPQERRIATVTPTPMAPPPGSVLETAVDAWLTTAASRRRIPGSAATSTNQ